MNQLTPNLTLYIFLATLLLLWLPYPFLGRRFKLRALQTRYIRPSLKQILSNWQNYFDFLRSGAGVYLLLHFALDLTGIDQMPLLLAGAILTIGVAIQMARLPSQAGLIAPLFYLGGMSAGMAGHLEAGFALLFGWLFAIGARDARFQLPAMGIALGLASYFNKTLNLLVIINVVLILFPNLLALILNQRLVFVAKESRPSRAPGGHIGAVESSPTPADKAILTNPDQ